MLISPEYGQYEDTIETTQRAYAFTCAISLDGPFSSAVTYFIEIVVLTFLYKLEENV